MKVMVVDDERIKRISLGDAIAAHGHDVAVFETAAKGLEALARKPFDVVITDLKMPEMDGISFLKRIKQISSSTYVILMTAYGTVDLAVEAMRQGAYDFIMKPFSNEEMLVRLNRIEEQFNLVTENIALKREIQRRHPGKLIGKSAGMLRLYETI